jgi:hypothetical protein
VGGVCHAFCEDDTSVCPGMNARCVQVIVNNGGVLGFWVCTRTCDPVVPYQEDSNWDACGAGLGCYPTMTGDSDCYGPTGSGQQGDACANLAGDPDDSLCAPGFFCSSDLVCLQYCRMASPACYPGTLCYNFNPVQFAGNVSIGYCW